MKICKVHGQLSSDEVFSENKKNGSIYLRCKFCKINKDRRWKKDNREQHIAASVRWKKENKEKYKSWEKEDRRKNPEKYRRYEQNYVKKYGIEHIRLNEVLRIHKLTKEQYLQMVNDQNNLCAICKKSETRKSKNSEEITPLCIDHCHKSEEVGEHKVRGLLCHACNILLGKSKDSIEILQSAIEYLKSFA